jgi:hypothetical protein
MQPVPLLPKIIVGREASRCLVRSACRRSPRYDPPVVSACSGWRTSFAAEPSPSVISRREAAEILDGYRALRLSLRHQVEEQAQRGNLRFVRNCDEVLTNLSSGHLDYRPSGK